jgi:hypothetical protein
VNALQTEALKFWTYALGMSILVGLFELFMPKEFKSHTPTSSSTSNETDVKEKAGEVEETTRKITRSKKKDAALTQANETKPKTDQSIKPLLKSPTAPQSSTQILTQLAIDALDILTPSSALGWVPLAPTSTFVGMAGATSALLSLSGVWRKVNSSG